MGGQRYKMVIAVRGDVKWPRQRTGVMCATVCLSQWKKLWKRRDPSLAAWVRVCLGGSGAQPSEGAACSFCRQSQAQC